MNLNIERLNATVRNVPNYSFWKVVPSSNCRVQMSLELYIVGKVYLFIGQIFLMENEAAFI